MWQYILGSLIGAITGLLPGFHINNVALMIFKLYLSHQQEWLWEVLFAAIIVNAAFSYLAAIYFNISDNDATFASTLSMKFAKRNLIKDYLLLAYLGISNSIVMLGLSLPLIVNYHATLYRNLLPFLPYLLMLIIIAMLWKAKKHEIIVAITSAILGILAFSSSANANYVLMPIFFGMFAIPAYIITGTSKPVISKLQPSISGKEIKRYWLASFLGLLASYLSSLIPATSPLIFFAPLARYLKTPKEMVVSLTTMTFSDALLSIFTIPITNNSRSGAGVMLQNIYIPAISQLPSLSIIAALLLFIYYPLYRLLIANAHVFIKLKPIVYGFLLIYILITTKLAGLLLLINASLIGIYAMKNNTSPSYILFVIIMPTLVSTILNL